MSPDSRMQADGAATVWNIVSLCVRERENSGGSLTSNKCSGLKVTQVTGLSPRTCHIASPCPTTIEARKCSPIMCACNSQLLLHDKHPQNFFDGQQQAFTSYLHVCRSAGLSTNL